MGRYRTNPHQAAEVGAVIVSGRRQNFRSGSAAGNPPLIFVAMFLFLALSPVAAAHEERLILSMEAGRCSLLVQAHEQSHTLRLRVRAEAPDCAISKEAMLQSLAAAFAKTDPPKLEGPYTSLFIGRLIDYPWLSQYLALGAYKDREWKRAKGKPAAVDVNKYVAAILAKHDVTAQIEETFGESGYRIVGVSVEKVLVGGFGEVPLYQGEIRSGKVPYDAMVWFRLEKR
ncbi:MAG: hypothetical protein ACOWYE_13765 [Desulfatiglandales bacterium]